MACHPHDSRRRPSSADEAAPARRTLGEPSAASHVRQVDHVIEPGSDVKTGDTIEWS